MRRGGKLGLVDFICGRVRHLFEMTGFAWTFDVFTSLDERYAVLRVLVRVRASFQNTSRHLGRGILSAERRHSHIA